MAPEVPVVEMRAVLETSVRTDTKLPEVPMSTEAMSAEAVSAEVMSAVMSAEVMSTVMSATAGIRRVGNG